MLGLIKKDLLMIKSNLKMILIIFIVFILVSLNGNGNFAFIPAFISVMLIMSTFSYDEYNKWDAYATTFPNDRKNVVKSKFIATFILILISLLVTLLLCLIIQYINNNINFKEIYELMMGCLIAIILLIAIMYPLIFKFGIEKSRIGIFIGIFSVTSIASILVKTKIEIPVSLLTFLNNYGVILFLGISLISILISYKVSKNIYLNKEF